MVSFVTVVLTEKSLYIKKTKLKVNPHIKLNENRLVVQFHINYYIIFFAELFIKNGGHNIVI